ncbi:MAG TPA: hypothetical protein VHL34_19070 [Rhizomicrobium sp.]|jgi:hypothetical protein|nr:hypothetical protein [Rhizomicrobium sp.]
MLSKRAWLAFSSFFLTSLLLGSTAQAGIYTDDLTKCIVAATSQEDQMALSKWIFTSISLHPAVRPLTKLSDTERDAMNKQAAQLFDRLITSDCRHQTVTALKYEGGSSLEASFKILGEIAMRTLMSDPAVSQGLQDMAKYSDQSKYDAISKEAGIPQAKTP